MKKKWIYAKMPGYITRATDMLSGEDEQVMTRKKPYFRPVGYEEERADLYGTFDRIVSEEEALKYAIEELGATREAFYKDDE